MSKNFCLLMRESKDDQDMTLNSRPRGSGRKTSQPSTMDAQQALQRWLVRSPASVGPSLRPSRLSQRQRQPSLCQGLRLCLYSLPWPELAQLRPQSHPCTGPSVPSSHTAPLGWVLRRPREVPPPGLGWPLGSRLPPLLLLRSAQTVLPLKKVSINCTSRLIYLPSPHTQLFLSFVYRLPLLTETLVLRRQVLCCVHDLHFFCKQKSSWNSENSKSLPAAVTTDRLDD